MSSRYVKRPRDEDISYTSRQRENAKKGEARADIIRTLPDAELEAYCVPWELAAVRGVRNHFAAMNQPELDFQATYDKDAARELRVRNGEQVR